MQESEVQKQSIALLEAAGWEVVVTANDKPLRGGNVGITDAIAVRHDRVVFIEFKRTAGKLRPSQKRFLRRVRPHLGEHVMYFLVDDPVLVEQFLSEKREARQ